MSPEPTELNPQAQAAWDAKVAEIRAEQAEQRAERQLWLSHHHPHEYDRCVQVGSRHVCRRCLILHPTAIVVGLAFVAGLSLWPERFDPWLIWALAMPATLDFALEQTGVVAYSKTRQVVATALLAPAVGRGLGYELQSRWSWEFWGPALVFSAVWYAATVIGRRRKSADAVSQAR